MGSISPELASKRRLLKFLGDETPVVGVPFAPSEHQPGKEHFLLIVRASCKSLFGLGFRKN
jgi:hypothetical protein